MSERLEKALDPILDQGVSPGVEGFGQGMSRRQIMLVFYGVMLGMLLAALDQTIVLSVPLVRATLAAVPDEAELWLISKISSGRRAAASISLSRRIVFDCTPCRLPSSTATSRARERESAVR